MARARKTAKKTTTPAPTPAPAPVRPATVRVEVARRYIGAPPLGEQVTVTRTPRLERMIRAGFLREIRDGGH